MFHTESDLLANLIVLSPKLARKRFRESIFEDWGWKCAYCDRQLNSGTATIDHIVPGPAVDEVGQLAAVEVIVPSLAVEVVGPGAAQSDVVSAAKVDGVVAVARVEDDHLAPVRPCRRSGAADGDLDPLNLGKLRLPAPGPRTAFVERRSSWNGHEIPF